MIFQGRLPAVKFLNYARRNLSTLQLFTSMLFLVWSSSIAEALSAASVKKTSLSTVTLQSVEASQLAILDGPEWASIQTLSEVPWSKSNYGFMNVIIGKDSEGQQIIGIQCDSERNVYQDSVAKVPSRVKKEDAIATYIATLSTVHAVLPKAEQVGGSQEAMIGGKVVIMGGNDLACFAAEGLASLGVQVCLVTTGNPKVKSSSIGKVQIVKPAVGADGIGFAAYVGQFDSLLDTISNERPFNTVERKKLEASDDAQDDETDSNDTNFFGSLPLESSKSVLSLLKARHNCHTYVSTVTQCQTIVAKEGLLGGPRQADEYAKRVGQQSFISGNPECQPIIPWSKLGNTVEALLGSGVIFTSKARDNLHQKSKSVRGWNLGDFWEQSTWPRDSSGSAQIRFGLPVVEDPNLDEEPLLLETPSRGTGNSRKTSYGEFDFSSKEDYLEDAPPKPTQENPFVYEVAGVQGVKSEIMEEELDCILFLSAKFCKTCRAISPQYTRMARLAKESSAPIVFAKAETSGRWGKELGRYFGVEAVPAFILFRKGDRFGSALSVSRLPSRKIDRALELLESGAAWDPNVLREDEKKRES